MKYICGMQINIDVFQKLLLSFWVCIARLVSKISEVSKIRSFYIFAISPAKHGMKLRFGLQVSTKVFSKLIVSLWVCKARHTKSTQNNMFAISFQYFKENTKDEVDFLPANKHKRFLQIDTIILGVVDQACSNYPK